MSERESNYRAAIMRDPTNATLWYYLAIVLEKQNQYIKAEEAYRLAIKYNPKLSDAWSNLGVILSKKQQYKEAKKAFQTSIKLNPTKEGAWVNLGTLLLEQKDFKKAEKKYRTALKYNPKCSEAWSNLGLTLRKLKKKESEVEQAYRNALKYDSKNILAWMQLGYLLNSQNKYSEAKGAWEMALKKAPAKWPYRTLIEEGVSKLSELAVKKVDLKVPDFPIPNEKMEEILECINQKQFQKALEKIKAALKKYTNREKMSEGRAFLIQTRVMCLSEMGEYLTAYNEIEQLIKNPDYTPTIQDYWIELNLTKKMSIEREWNLENLNKILQLARIYDFIAEGIQHEQQQAYDKAIQIYQHALAINSDYIITLYRLARIHDKKNEVTEAKEYYQKIIDKGKTPANVWYNYGLICHKEGDLNQAMESYLKAVGLEPRLSLAWHNLGMIYQRQIKLDEAEQMFKRSLALDPTYRNSWFYLGKVYMATERFHDALDAMEKVLALNSDDTEVKPFLKLLKFTIQAIEEKESHPDKQDNQESIIWSEVNSEKANSNQIRPSIQPRLDERGTSEITLHGKLHNGQKWEKYYKTTSKWLALGDNDLLFIDLKPLVQHPKLQKIHLTNTRLRTVDLTPLADCSDLQAISLICNQLTEIDLAPLARCQLLRSLSINNNYLDYIDLSPLSSCSHLQWLYISNNDIASLDLSPLAKCHRLEILALSGNPLTSVDLTPLSSCTHLQQLFIGRTLLKLIDITPLLNLTKLTSFSIPTGTQLFLTIKNPQNLPAALQNKDFLYRSSLDEFF